jgi:hypothetical protein
MLMLGKMSIGVRRADPTPKFMISSAITTKVYGRRSAILTMPIMIASKLLRMDYQAKLLSERARRPARSNRVEQRCANAEITERSTRASGGLLAMGSNRRRWANSATVMDRSLQTSPRSKDHGVRCV